MEPGELATAVRNGKIAWRSAIFFAVTIAKPHKPIGNIILTIGVAFIAEGEGKKDYPGHLS